MGYIVTIAIILAIALVVFALVKGLVAFANMKPNDVDENGVPKSLRVQNKMMFARVKWQAIAVILLALLMIIANAG